MGVFLLLTACLFSFVHSINVIINPGLDECYFERIQAETNVYGSFVVWDDQTINVRVMDPNNKVMYSTLGEKSGTFSFVTASDASEGDYTVCFQNAEYIYSKFVGFHLHFGDEVTAAALLKHEHLTPVEHAVSVLAQDITGLLDEMQFLKGREIAHRDTNESTFARVTYWGVFKHILLIAVAVANLLVIRSLFETKNRF